MKNYRYFVFGVLIFLSISAGYGYSQNVNNRYDTQNFTGHRDIHNSASNINKSLVGQEDDFNTKLIGRWAKGPCTNVSVDGNIACFNDGPILNLIDISNPMQPQKLCEYVLPVCPSKIILKNNYIYIVDDFSGLRIIEYMNPNNLKEVGFLYPTEKIYNIYINSNYAYFIANKRLHVIDISDPKSLKEITLSYEVYGGMCGFSKGYLYLRSGQGGLSVIDISNPLTPNLVSNFETWEFDACINDDFAFILDWRGRILIIDNKTPSNITQLGQIEPIYPIDKIFASNDYLYIIEGSNFNLHIIDVSKPDQPIEIGVVYINDKIKEICFFDNYVFVAMTSRFCILDISNPANPQEICFIETAGQPEKVIVDKDLAFVAAGKAGVHIVDISHQDQPQQLSNFNTRDEAKDIFVVGDLLYIADGDAGMCIVDVSNPTRPIEISFCQIEGFASELFVKENYAFVALHLEEYYDETGLCTIDITDSSSPLKMSSLEGLDGLVNDIFVANNEVWLTGYGFGIHLIDISKPFQPARGFYYLGEDSKSIFIDNNNAYIGIETGLGIFDISEITNIKNLANLRMSSYCYIVDVTVNNNFAYLSDFYNGLRVLDISDKRKPMETGFFATTGNCCGVYFQTPYIYVTDNYNGLYIVDFLQDTVDSSKLSLSAPLEIQTGQDFWLDIQIDSTDSPINDLYGASFVLNYQDTQWLDVVQPQSSNDIVGDIWGSSPVFFSDVDDAAGQVSLGISRKSGGVNGYGSLARIHFKVAENTPDGTTLQFDLSDLNIIDSNGTTIPVNTSSCQITVKSGKYVWPGDADNNGYVDQEDIFPIGMYFQSTGAARTNASNLWSAQQCALWSNESAMYADCNGNGEVDRSDILAIGLNWHKSHTTSLAKTGTVKGGNAVQCRIESLGENAGLYQAIISVNDLQDMMGLAFCLTAEIGQESIALQNVSYNGVYGEDIIHFDSIDTETPSVSVGISRKACNGSFNGSGDVCFVRFQCTDPELAFVSFRLTDVVGANTKGETTSFSEQEFNYTFVQQQNQLPDRLILYTNHPNPFNPITTIQFDVPVASTVQLEIININGKTVRTLVNEQKQAGSYSVRWNARNDAGMAVASGVYLYRLRDGNEVITKKLLYTK